MKRITFLLLILLVAGVSMVKAGDAYLQHLSPEEFRAKQQAFITERAGLTADEAAKFFPIYFELQAKKKELNDKSWKLLHQGKEKDISEEKYEEIILGIYDLKIESNQLEKSYYSKFREVLSAQKIYLVQRAETRFHRELVKGASRGKGDGPQQQRTKK